MLGLGLTPGPGDIQQLADRHVKAPRGPRAPAFKIAPDSRKVENGASTIARLAAWNKRQARRLESQAERQGRRLVRKAEGPLTSKP